MNRNAQEASEKRKLFVTCEEAEDEKCDVIGDVPKWLQGEVIRNGPGEFELGPDKFNHLFDGHAFLHKFSIENGRVHYTGKFIKSKQFQHNHEHQRLLYGGFGTGSFADPCKNIFSRFAQILTTQPDLDNINVNVTKVGNAHYAIMDGAAAYRFDPETLDTIKFEDFGRILNLPVATAHPHYDTNGDYYNIGTSFGRKSFYEVIKIPAADMQSEDPLSKIQVHSKIPNDTPFSPSYYHSFVLTKNFIAFYDQPTRISIAKLLWAKYTWGPIAGVFDVDKKHSYFHVIDKASGTKLATKYVIEPQLCFHFINSFEVSTEKMKYLVIDMCCHSEMQRLDDPQLSADNYMTWKKVGDNKMTFKRFVLPLNIDEATPKGSNLVEMEGCGATAVLRTDGSVFLTHHDLIEEESREDLQVEMPQINHKYNGKKYRHIYSIGRAFKRQTEFLVKTDTETKQVKLWTEQDCVPSEPIFVARPNTTEEDNGIVLSTVVALQKNKPAFLLILDANSFKEIARAQISSLMSFSLHAHFHHKGA